jgi:hypothetical protein
MLISLHYNNPRMDARHLRTVSGNVPRITDVAGPWGLARHLPMILPYTANAVTKAMSVIRCYPKPYAPEFRGRHGRRPLEPLARFSV